MLQRFRKTLLPTAALLSLTACSAASTAGDGYVRFTIEEVEFQGADHELMTLQAATAVRFQLVPTSGRALPSVTISWLGRDQDLPSLAGTTVSLGDINSSSEPMVLFRLDEDVSVQLDRGSSFDLTITAVDDGFVEGRFAGRRMTRVSMTEEGVRTVSVSGEFRVPEG